MFWIGLAICLMVLLILYNRKGKKSNRFLRLSGQHYVTRKPSSILKANHTLSNSIQNNIIKSYWTATDKASIFMLLASSYGAPDVHFQPFCDFLELSYDQEHYVSVG